MNSGISIYHPATAAQLLDQTPDWQPESYPDISLKLLEPGLLRVNYQGQLSIQQIELIQTFSRQFNQWSLQQKQFFIMVFDATEVDIKDLGTRYYMLKNLRWEANPYLLKLEYISNKPLLILLAKMLMRLNSHISFRLHSNQENALKSARELLSSFYTPQSTDTEPALELLEHQHLSADGKCRLEFFVIRGHILLIRLYGGLRVESAQHLIKHLPLITQELLKTYQRIYTIAEIREVIHDQKVPPAIKLLQEWIQHELNPFEKAYTILPPTVRGVVRMLKRLLPDKMSNVEPVEGLANALKAIEQHESYLGMSLNQNLHLPKDIQSLQNLVRRQQQELARLNTRKDFYRENLEEVVTNMVLNSDFTPLNPEPIPPEHPLAQLSELLYVLQFDWRNLIDTLRDEIREREAAQNEAAEASEIKSRFLAHMSHELRTPLNAILGFSSLLLQKSEMSEAKRQTYLERIQHNGKHLLILVNDILDLSRIDASHLKLKLSLLDVSDLLKRVASQFELEVQQKNLRFEVLAATPCLVKADSVRLTQILTNLLHNAFKFTEQGKIVIECLPGESAHLIEVRDTGIGIAPEHQQRIFEAFTQVDNRIQRAHSGAGLGLAISKELCELMNFRLEIQSQLGQGSVFRIVMPVEA